MPVIVVNKTRKHIFEGTLMGANLFTLHIQVGDETCQLLSSYKLSFDKALFLRVFIISHILVFMISIMVQVTNTK